MRRILLATTALLGLAAATPASADVLLGGLNWSFNGVDTLTLTNAVPTGNQVKNLPCLICGANQPQQPANFGFNDFGNTGALSNLLFFSSGIVNDKTVGQDTLAPTNYSGAFLINFLQSIGDPSLTFNIGIDVNDTNVRQTLESFFFLDVTSKTVLAAFINGTTGNLLSPNNGTGFPDMTLGPLSLAGLDPTHQYAFFSRISGANDGPDSFFLVATPTIAAVPELSSWIMFLVGFAAVGGLAMKRKGTLRFA